MDNPYIGRIVAFVVTPLVTALTAWLVPLVAEHFPGTPQLDEQQLGLLGVAGVVAVGAAAWQWLKNRGDWERLEVLKAEALAGDLAEAPVPRGSRR